MQCRMNDHASAFRLVAGPAGLLATCGTSAGMYVLISEFYSVKLIDCCRMIRCVMTCRIRAFTL